jgi:hypothetical protein
MLDGVILCEILQYPWTTWSRTHNKTNWMGGGKEEPHGLVKQAKTILDGAAKGILPSSALDISESCVVSVMSTIRCSL